MVIISHCHPETTGQPAFQPKFESDRGAERGLSSCLPVFLTAEAHPVSDLSITLDKIFFYWLGHVGRFCYLNLDYLNK